MSIILVLEECVFESLKVLEKSLNFVLCVCYEPWKLLTHLTHSCDVVACNAQMQAVDRDSGVNSELSYSVIYDIKSHRVFDVRPKPDNPSIAELYTIRRLDRESTDYGAVTYKGTVTLKVIEINILKEATNNLFNVVYA